MFDDQSLECHLAIQFSEGIGNGEIATEGPGCRRHGGQGN